MSDKTLQMIYLVMIVLLGLTDTIDYATMTIPLFIGPMIVENSLNREREERENCLDNRHQYISF